MSAKTLFSVGSLGAPKHRPLTSSNAPHKVASLCSSKGSKFFRNVPENRIGSWGMMEIFERQCWRLTIALARPSMTMAPSSSQSRNSAWIRDDLPAPVRPTIPIYMEWNENENIDLWKKTNHQSRFIMTKFEGSTSNKKWIARMNLPFPGLLWRT